MNIRKLIDLAPGEDNPRNSEGAFLTLRDGRVAYLYSRYKGGSASDDAYAEIAVIYYDGNGFTEPEILVKPEPGTDETNCMSVSAARMDNGDAAVIYLVKHVGCYNEIILRRSTDEFRTLDDGVLCISSLYKNYYVVNNDRIVRLGEGRWMLPAAVHPSSMLYHNNPDHVDGRSKAAFYLSEDDGRTWRQISDSIALPGGAHSTTGLQEPGTVVLPGGTLYSYFRTDLGRQYESVSTDGGITWYPPQPSQFTSPASPLLIKRNEYNGKYYAVWNPVPETPFRYHKRKAPSVWTGGRTPLVLASSEDGIHFGTPYVIEDDENAGFCYPAMHFTSESSMLMSYCAGGVEPGDSMCLVRTRIIEITDIDF